MSVLFYSKQKMSLANFVESLDTKGNGKWWGHRELQQKAQLVAASPLGWSVVLWEASHFTNVS